MEGFKFISVRYLGRNSVLLSRDSEGAVKKVLEYNKGVTVKKNQYYL